MLPTDDLYPSVGMSGGGGLSTRSRASSLRHPLPYRSATWRLLTWTDKVLTGVNEKHALDRMIYNSRYLERSNNMDNMDNCWVAAVLRLA